MPTNKVDFKELYNRYKELVTSNKRTKGASRKISKNVELYIDHKGEVRVMLHSTAIITFHEDGKIDGNNGGWDTPTTRKNMNIFLSQGVYMFQKKNKQYVQQTDFDPEEYNEKFWLVPLDEFYEIKTDLKKEDENDKIKGGM